MNVPKSLFAFLAELKSNNNRQWFEDNKPTYQVEEKKIKLFFDEILRGLNTMDSIEKMKIFRIYKDVRFSKDKTPYKTNRSANWIRAGEHRRGGYYLQLEPGNSYIAGGFFQPNPKDLFRIRKEFEADDMSIRSILAETQFHSIYGGFAPHNAVKIAPKGFDKDHKAIDLIRHKSFFVTHYFTDAEVFDDSFSEQVLSYFKLLHPFFDYMSEVLTTDLNGVSTID